VAECRRLKAQGGELSLAAAPLFLVFEAKRVTDSDHVRADVADDQKTIVTPQQRHMSRRVTGRVDDPQPASERQRLAVLYVLVDSYRRDGLVWAPEDAEQDSLGQVWRWRQCSKRPAALRDRNV